MRILRTLIVATAVSAALVTTACSGGDRQGQSPPTAPTTTGPAPTTSAPEDDTDQDDPTDEPTGSDPTDTASPTDEEDHGGDEAGGDCGEELTGAQAVARWIDRVPPSIDSPDPYPWDPGHAVIDHYDPCAELSWIVLPIEGGTVSSPYQIMLFGKGDYLGTTFAQAPGFHPEVHRLSDTSIEVTYRWPRDGEPNANPSGRSVATFTIDPATSRVTHAGDIPPHIAGGDTPREETPTGQPERPTDGARDDEPPVPGAYPGAGGPRPENAIPVPTVRREQFAGEIGVITSPTGNIGCDLHLDYAGCGVLSYLTDQPYGEDWVGPLWWVDLSGDTAGRVVSKGDAPWFGYDDPAPAVVEYGQVVYFHNTVCASAENGLTCWNTRTGHGALISASSVDGF